MFKFNSKKGMDKMWWIVGTALLVIIVVAIILSFFNESGGKAFDVVGDNIDSLGDCDEDQVANMFDKCPCDKIGNEENPDLEGCPKSITNATDCTTTEEESCKDNGVLN